MQPHAALETAGRHGRLTLVALGVLAALPFLATRHPPATDLGQHVAQLRLLSDALAGARPDLEISWAAPGTGVYGVLWLLARVLPLGLVGPVALAGAVMAWAVALGSLAAARGRDPAAALVALPFAFGACVYWGLLQFLVGWPLFFAWLGAVERWRGDVARTRSARARRPFWALWRWGCTSRTRSGWPSRGSGRCSASRPR